MTGNPGATARDGVVWVQNLCHALSVPPLARYGITSEDVVEVVNKAKNSSSMKGNPIALTGEELVESLTMAL